MVDIGYSQTRKIEASVPVTSWKQIYREHRKLSYENIESVLMTIKNRLSPETNKTIFTVIAEVGAILDSIDTLKEYIIDVSFGETSPRESIHSLLIFPYENTISEETPQERLRQKFQQLWQRADEHRERAIKMKIKKSKEPDPTFEPIRVLIARGWKQLKKTIKRDLFTFRK